MNLNLSGDDHQATSHLLTNQRLTANDVIRLDQSEHPAGVGSHSNKPITGRRAYEVPR